MSALPRTRWSDPMILASVRDREMLTRQAELRARELAAAGLIDDSRTWRLTDAGHAACAGWRLELEAL